MYTLNRKPYKNGLTPIPAKSDLAIYQTLAHAGKLWFYDDHLQVVCIHAHPLQPGKFIALVANRDTKTVSAEPFTYLGRGFLTTPKNAERVESGTLAPVESLATLRAQGFTVPFFRTPSNVPSTTALDFEHWMAGHGPDLLVEFANRPASDLKT